MGLSLAWMEAFASYANLLLSCGLVLIIIGILGKNGIEIKEIKLVRLESWQIVVANILGVICLSTFVYVHIAHYLRNIPSFDVRGTFVLWDWEDEQKGKTVQIRVESQDALWPQKGEVQEVIFGEDFTFSKMYEGSYKVAIIENEKIVKKDLFTFDKGRKTLFITKENGVYNARQGDWLQYILKEYNTTKNNQWERKNRAAFIVEKLIHGDDSRFVEALQYTSLAIRVLEKTCGGDQDTYKIQKYIMQSESDDSGHVYLRMRSASGLMCAQSPPLRNLGKDFLFAILNDARKKSPERFTAAAYLHSKGAGKRICVIDQFVLGVKTGYDTCEYCAFLTKNTLEEVAIQYFRKTKDEIQGWEAADWEHWWNEERSKREKNEQWQQDCGVPDHRG